jgi:signal transduction histidine kinase
LLQSRLAAITVKCDYGDLAPLKCYPKQLNQVFMSLITNAIEAIDRRAGESPLITITTATQGDEVMIQITDNGIGINAEIQSKVFDPFFTTKDVGQGMGLGLTNSYQIIQDIHHGRLELTSAPNDGATLTIWLPID